MKKYISGMAAAILLTSLSLQAEAQGIWDAYSFSQQNPDGTARSVAMGNAFTALGGDMGSIWLNPAGSAVNSYSEIGITPGLNITNSSTNYGGFSSDANKTRFGISNAGYVGTYDVVGSSVKAFSFGVVLNKMNEFTQSYVAGASNVGSSWLQATANSAQGYDSSLMEGSNAYWNNVPWNCVQAYKTFLIDPLPDSSQDYFAAIENLDDEQKVIYMASPVNQSFSSVQTGSNTQIDLNFGMNFDDKLYLGFNFGFQSIYRRVSQYYYENAVNSLACNSGFSSFEQSYYETTNGTGINLKAGLIYVPAPFIRFGAAIQTPTWMWLSTSSDMAMISEFNDGKRYSEYSPVQSFNYRLRSPFRFNAGVAVTIAKMAVLSLDYQMVDYSSMKYSSSNNIDWSYENDKIKEYAKVSNIIRAGAEVNFPMGLSVRAGYQYYGSGISKDYSLAEDNMSLASAGLGFSTASGFFIDLAYQRIIGKAESAYRLYNSSDAPWGNTKFGADKVLLTFGLRF